MPIVLTECGRYPLHVQSHRINNLPGDERLIQCVLS